VRCGRFEESNGKAAIESSVDISGRVVGGDGRTEWWLFWSLLSSSCEIAEAVRDFMELSLSEKCMVSSSQENVDEPESSLGANQVPAVSFLKPLAPANHPPAHTPVLETNIASASEFTNCPRRSCQPPKKPLGEVSRCLERR
jgi:hypothetical protein